MEPQLMVFGGKLATLLEDSNLFLKMMEIPGLEVTGLETSTTALPT
jgi:hypothetical protein